MTPQHQLYRHEPDNGIHGDCHRTVIACLLDLKPHQVPHFVQLSKSVEGYIWQEGLASFLAERDLASVDVCYEGELKEVLHCQTMRNPDAYYVLAGMSPRGTNHAVIACGAELVWDPHPDGGFLVGPLSSGVYEISYLVPLFMTRADQ